MTRFGECIAVAWRWSGTKWALLAVAIVSSSGWALDLRPLATVWGPVGTWVGGIATASGLVFTGIQIRDTRRQRAQDEVERREAMARSVSVSTVVKEVIQGDPNGFWIEYTVANGGDFPIENVVLVVIDLDADDIRPQDQVGTCMELVIGTMHHKQVISDTRGPLRVGRPAAFGEITALGSVIFTDTWGQSWWRGTGELVQLDNPARVC